MTRASPRRRSVVAAVLLSAACGRTPPFDEPISDGDGGATPRADDVARIEPARVAGGARCAPRRVWSGPGAFDQLAVDEHRIYFIATAGAALGANSIPKDGGDFVHHGDVVYFGDTSNWDIATDGRHVFWLSDGDYGPSCGAGGFISRDAVTGGAPERIAAWTDVNRVRRLALDGDHVYFTEAPYVCSATGIETRRGGGVGRVPKAGGAVTLLAAAERPFGIAVAGDTVFWVEQADGSVRSVPREGGAVTTLARALTPTPAHLVADAEAVFVADAVQGTIWRVPRTGGAPSVLYRPAADARVTDLAAGAAHLYWSTGGWPQGGEVARIGKDGRGFERLAAVGSPSVAVDPDGAAVYYGAVERACP